MNGEDINAKIRAMKPDDLAMIEIATSGAMGRPGEVSFIPWNGDVIRGQAWDSVTGQANVDEKLIDNVVAVIRANPGWNFINLGMGNSLFVSDQYTPYAISQMRGKHPYNVWCDLLQNERKASAQRDSVGYCGKFRQLQSPELVDDVCKKIAAKNIVAVANEVSKLVPPFLSNKQEVEIDRTYFIGDEIEANCYIQHEEFRRILIKVCSAFLSWDDFERGKALRDKYGQFDLMWAYLGASLTAFETLTIEYIGEGTHDVIVSMLYRFFEGRRDESVAKEFGIEM